MIDFRYHLVSIVAVFLALAIGIVLGAGPLKEDLGDALDDQVTALREDRNALRAELDAAEQRAQLKDEYAALTAPSVVEDRLTEQRVALVVLPEADPDQVSRTEGTLRSAGAEVVSTTVLGQDWTDPEAQETRSEIAARLAPEVGLEPTLVSTERLLGDVLAAALAGNSGAGQLGAWREVLQELNDTGMVQYTWHGTSTDPDPDSDAEADPDSDAEAGSGLEDNRPATSVAVVAGPMDPEEDDHTERLAAHLALLTSLGSQEHPAVLAGPGIDADGAPVGSVLLGAAREDEEVAGTVSTVDNAATPMGQTTLVLALEEEYGGGTGHYGFAEDAGAVAPQPRERDGEDEPEEPEQPQVPEETPTQPAPTTTGAP